MISIIVPVYNVRPYLEQCVRSIIAQTYQDWECILVDDGSTDGSGELCEKLVSEDERLKVIHQKNQGVSVARNHGIEISKGEYICFIDSDDWVEPTYLSHLYEVYTNNDIDIAVSGIVTEGNESLRDVPDTFAIIKMGQSNTKIFIDNIKIFYGPVALLFKACIIHNYNVLFPNTISFGEDTIFTFSYLSHINTIAFIPHIDYHYRKHNNKTLSFRFGESKTLLRYDLWKLRESFLKKKDMWNKYSQENMFRELWAIVYDGIFSTPNPSLRFLKKLLRIAEISYLKDWESLFNTSKTIKFGIEHRTYHLFYILRRYIIK